MIPSVPWSRRLHMLVLVCLAILVSCNRHADRAQQIHVVFRFDDYSANSSTDLELRVIDVFRKNQASVTFAVIPFDGGVPLDQGKADILKASKQDGVVDIALHGHTHGPNDVGGPEFSGLDYGTQVKKIAEGKRFLEDVLDAPVTTFVPPHNVYDLNTVRALQELGFSTLSAGGASRATNDTAFNYVPRTCLLDGVRGAVRTARRSSETRPVIVVGFHHYDFKETNHPWSTVTFQELSDLLSWLKSQPDVRMMSIGAATTKIEDFSGARLLANQPLDLEKLVPPPWRTDYSLYIESDSLPDRLRDLWTRLLSVYLAVFGVVILASFLVSKLLMSTFKFTRKALLYGNIAVFAVVPVYLLCDQNVRWKGLAAAIAAVGATTGVWLSHLYTRKREPV